MQLRPSRHLEQAQHALVGLRRALEQLAHEVERRRAAGDLEKKGVII